MSTKGGAVGSSRGLPGAPAGELGQSFSTICISMSKWACPWAFPQHRHPATVPTAAERTPQCLSFTLGASLKFLLEVWWGRHAATSAPQQRSEGSGLENSSAPKQPHQAAQKTTIKTDKVLTHQVARLHLSENVDSCSVVSLAVFWGGAIRP